MAPPARQRFNFIVFCVCAALLWLFFFGDLRAEGPDFRNDNLQVAPGPDETEMIVASTTSENLTWLGYHLQDWKKNIYVVDDPLAPLTVPQNKGRESMVFLTCV